MPRLAGLALRRVVGSTTMASADFCSPIPTRYRADSTWQANRPPRVMRATPSCLYPPHIRPCFPYKYRALKIAASSPSMTASYAISVRRVSILPAASFGFHLAMDTLAVRLAVPLVGPAEDFHLQVTRQAPHLPGWCSRTTRPAGRTKEKVNPKARLTCRDTNRW